MKVLIYACEAHYHGLYGIYDMRIEEFDDRTKLSDIFKKWVPEMSENIVYMYDTFYTNRYDFDSDEAYNKALEKELIELMQGCVAVIDSDEQYSTKEWENIASSMGVGNFIEKYCGEILIKKVGSWQYF